MSEGAAHLVDGVLPALPIRQWVLSLPFALRFAVARDHGLLTAVLGVAMRAMLGFQRARAIRLLGVRGRGGAVTVVQRFGSALNMNIHFHAIVLDGVHVEGNDGRVRFRVLPAPTAREKLKLTETIAQRVRRLLKRKGLLADDESFESAETPSALDLCQVASLRSVAALGQRAGRPLRKIVLPLPSAANARATHESRGVAGFDLDIGPVVGANDRARLERLCRYALRPPLATERLEELPDGRVKYGLRHRWRDGTVAVVMEPLGVL